MTDADKAYAEAERLIELAKEEGWEELRFDDEAFGALEVLPNSLSDLSNLTGLNLNNTQVADLTPLQALSNLTVLYLINTQVADLTPLQALSNLAALSLQNTQVADLAPLRALSNLTVLNLNNTQVADITPLRALSNLTALSLKITQVADLAPLQALSNLRRLSLDNTQVADLAPLQALSNLTELSLEDTQVADIAPLQALSNLTVLVLDHTQVADIAPLQALSNLTGLYLINTQVADIAPLQALSNLTELYLEDTQVADLAPLRALSNLTGLSLGNTKVVDIAPLQALSNLTMLSLDDTQVLDLRPLTGLTRLVEEPGLFGLTFQNTRAAQLDTKIAEIAEIEDSATRARTLFDYLENWQPPGEGEDTTAPAPDPLFPVAQFENGLEVAASCPTAEEQEDALKRAMHRSLPELLERLAREAGNQFPRLAEAVRRLAALLDQPFEELDMVLIHLGFNELRAAEKAGEEEDMTFPASLRASLTSACDAGGGLTVDHPMVTLLMDRARKARDNPDPREDRETQDAMSQQVAKDQAAMGERLRALEARVANSDDPQDHEAQKAVNRNILWKIGITVGGFCLLSVAGKVVGDVLGQPLVDFIHTNLPLLYQTAQTYGPAFADWFLSSLSKVQDFAGIIANLPRPPR